MQSQHGHCGQSVVSLTGGHGDEDMLQYRAPQPLTSDKLGSRIFSPFAYRMIRESMVVPVGYLEAIELSIWLPIVWRNQAGGHQLVTVRSLIPGESGVPADSIANLHALPLIALAYPLMYPPGQPVVPQGSRWIDSELVDQPTDAGAPIVDIAGKPTKGATMRMRALDDFAEQLPATEAITRFLVEKNLLEPWKVSFDVAGKRIGYDDLMVVRSAAFDGGDLMPIFLELGAAGARFFSAHRLSLFRAGTLLRTARLVLEKQPVAAGVSEGRPAVARGRP